MDNSHNNIGLFPQMPVCEGNFGTDVNSDFSLPDYKSEIKRLISTKATLPPPKQYIGNDSAHLEGDIIYKILYTGMDSALYCATLTDKYKFELPLEFDMHSINSDDVDIFWDCECESVNTRVLGPRKLNVRARVVCRALALSPSLYSPEICGSHSCEDIEKKIVEAPSLYIKKCVSDVFTLTDRVPLDPQTDSVRIIGSSAEISVSESLPSVDKITVKGDVILKLLYCNDAESEQAQTMIRKLPFSEILDCNGVDAGFECSSWGEAYEEQLNIDENGISIELCMSLISVAQKNQSVKYCTDAFSTQNSCSAKHMNINIPSAVKCQRGNLTQNNTFELTDFKIDPNSKLIDVTTDIKIHSADVENKKLVLHGECLHHVLYHCDGEYSIRDINTPIRYESDLRFNETDDSSIHCFTHPTCTSTRGRCDSERLYIDSELSFSMLAYKKERIELIDSITIKEPLEKYTRGMTIFYPDKKTTLWDVAKRYGESIEALKKKNSLPDTLDISKKKYLVI